MMLLFYFRTMNTLSIFLLVLLSSLLPKICDAASDIFQHHPTIQLSEKRASQDESFGSIYTARYIYNGDCPVPEKLQFHCGEGGTIRALDDGQGAGTSFCVPMDSGNALECVGPHITIMCIGTTAEHWLATVTAPGATDDLFCTDERQSRSLSLQPICRDTIGISRIAIPTENVFCDENSGWETLVGMPYCITLCLDGVCPYNQVPDLIFAVKDVLLGEACLWDPSFKTITDVDTSTLLVSPTELNEQITVRVLHLVSLSVREDEFCQLQSPSLLTVACGAGARIDFVNFETDLTDSGCERQATNVLQCTVETSLETLNEFQLPVSCQGDTMEKLAIQADFVSEQINCRPDTTGNSDGNLNVVYGLEVLQYCNDSVLYPGLILIPEPYIKAPAWHAQECWPFEASFDGSIIVDWFDKNNNTIVDQDEVITSAIEVCGKGIPNCFDETIGTFACDENGAQPAGPLRVFIRAENIVLDTQCYLPLVIANEGSTTTSSPVSPGASGPLSESPSSGPSVASADPSSGPSVLVELSASPSSVPISGPSLSGSPSESGAPSSGPSPSRSPSESVAPSSGPSVASADPSSGPSVLVSAVPLSVPSSGPSYYHPAISVLAACVLSLLVV